MLTELVIVFLVAGLLFVALHYMPWAQMHGHPLKPPWTYVCGIIGLSSCYTLLLLYWQVGGRMYPSWTYLLAWGLIVTAGGGAVIGCYWLDDKLENSARARDEKAREEMEAAWSDGQTGEMGEKNL